MPTQSKNQWRAWTGKIGASWKAAAVLLAFLLSSGLAYFVYENFVNVPDVVYAVLPTYELEGQSFSGLVSENKGKATAHEIRMSLGRLGTTIVQTSIQSEEGWSQEGGRSGEPTLVVSLDRMASGSSVTVYMLTEEAPQLNDIAITTEEGPGRVAGGPSIGALAMPALFGAVIGGIVASTVWWWMYSRLRSQSATSELVSTKLIGAYKGHVSFLESTVNSQEDELEGWRTGKRAPPPPPNTVVTMR